MTLDRPG